MYNIQQDLLDAYRAGPDIFRALLTGLTPEQARQGSNTPGEWSAIEIVCHLRDAEERSLERMRRMRDEQNPTLEAYDQEAWVLLRNYASADLPEALRAFTQYREQHVAELARLSPQEWMRAGQHEEVGQISILDLIIHKVCHDLVHAGQLARLRGSNDR